MAKISNTSAYPNITPDGEDYLILTDKENALATKTATLNSIATFFTGTSLLQTSVTLSTTNLLNLFSTPITLIAAPGANNYIQIISATVIIDFVSVAFDFNTASSEIVLETSTNELAFITGAKFNVVEDVAYNFAYIDEAKLTPNTALTIKAQTSNPTQGNGSAVINLLYRVINQA